MEPEFKCQGPKEVTADISFSPTDQGAMIRPSPQMGIAVTGQVLEIIMTQRLDRPGALRLGMNPTTPQPLVNMSDSIVLTHLKPNHKITKPYRPLFIETDIPKSRPADQRTLSAD